MLIRGSNRLFFCGGTAKLLGSIDRICFTGEVSKGTDNTTQVFEKCLLLNCLLAFIIHWDLFKSISHLPRNTLKRQQKENLVFRRGSQTK